MATTPAIGTGGDEWPRHLHAEREAVFTQQHELEGKLAAINNELRAIDAYEAAKSGKATPARQTGTRRAPQARPLVPGPVRRLQSP